MAVIPLASNPLVGAGFESFWLNPRVHGRLWEIIPGLPLNEAHDGYIEVYLNLGWVGVSLIVLVLADGYRRAVKVFRREPALGGLLLAYVLTAVTYNITEAGFRMLNPFWIFFLLAAIEASNFAGGFAVLGTASVDAVLEPSSKSPSKKSSTAEQPKQWPRAGKTVRRLQT